ncbi:MAG: hypothetical protein WCG90_08430 [Chitinophagia bacterium]
MKTFRIPSPLPLLLLLIGILLIGLCSCNSVKKSTDIQINKVDSSSKVNIDSNVVEKKAISVDSSSLKTWDKETVIEFFNNATRGVQGYFNSYPNSVPLPNTPSIEGNRTFFADSSLYVYPVIGYEDGQIKVKGKIKKITIREKGKDSSNLKKVDNSQKDLQFNKGGSVEVSRKEKVKETNKQSTRVSTGLMVSGGIVLIVGIFFFLAYKRSQAILPNKEENNGKL